MFNSKNITMDCATAAAELKKLLLAHGTAETQVTALGKFFSFFNCNFNFITQ